MITIVPYTAEWSIAFATEASSLRAALGALALRIDHIGSTSVPGLAAKDIIDIQVTVQGFVPDIEDPLVGLGYTSLPHITADHRPPYTNDPDSEWAKQLYRRPDLTRPINLHVRAQNRVNQRYALLFRDYLRTHPGAAGAYALIKQHLAHYHPTDWDAYYDIKDPACDLIWQGAEEWAQRITWVAGSSDG
ncbi:MAG: GrpB family protein [Ardenticatenales bacterium]|nr:GrpB family protein [Ardenticatenales bacterium]